MTVSAKISKFKASAPATLMLLGEYAVLHDFKAIVSAIDKRISISLNMRHDDQIIINSDRYGQYQSSFTAIEVKEPFHFILRTIKQFHHALPSGAVFHIKSEFSDQVGFGSSAALVAATLGLLNQWLNLGLSLEDLVKHGKEIINDIQGSGSGADIAAAIFGGIISYQKEPLLIEKFNCAPHLAAYYCGFKTKTADAIKMVAENFKSKPNEFNSLMTLIGDCATEGTHYVRNENWPSLGKIFLKQQKLMTALGVNLPILQQMLDILMLDPNTYGAKISGSGFGDSIIVLTAKAMSSKIDLPGVLYYPISITQLGLHCEKIS